MPALVLDVLVIAGVVAVLWARSEIALGVLLVAVFVVPAPMRVPHTHSAYITVLHVLVLAGLGRLLVRWADGRLGPTALRMTAVHVAWVAFAVVAFAVGVVFVVTPGGLSMAGMRLADLGTQIGFFVVALALLRQLVDLWAAVNVAAVAVVVSAVIAVVEHVTGDAWGHWLFAWDPNAFILDAAHPLGLRLGDVRVRAGAEFALQYAWMAVTMLPIVLVAGLRSRRWHIVLPVASALTVLAVYWSFSRSALAGIGAVVLLLALLAREVRATRLAFVGVMAGGLALLAHAAFIAHLSTKVDTGSISARFERIAPILHAVGQHPFRGLGLGNLLQAGFPTTDNAFLLEYVELGAIGVAILGVLLLVGLGQTAWSLAAAGDDDRLIGAACATGVIAYLASAMFYDAFTLLQGAMLVWFLVALGTVVAERSGHARTIARPTLRWVALTAVAAAGVGFGAVALAPTHVGVDAVFTAMAPQQLSGSADPTTTGNVLAGSVCAASDLAGSWPASATVHCRIDPNATGYGRLHFEAASRDGLFATTNAFADVVQRRLGIASLQMFPVDPPRAGRLAIWQTAPAWVPIGVVGILVLVPWRRRATAA